MTPKLKQFLMGVFGSAISATGASLQTNEILEIISIALTIFGAVISFIVIPVYNWWKHAKKDGKIDKEEIHEIHETIAKNLTKIKSDNAKKEEKEKDEE